MSGATPGDAAPDGELEVVRTHLELPVGPSSGDLPPVGLPDPDARVVRRDPCPVSEYRALYQAVGAAHRWRDRLAWSDATLGAWLARPEVAIWVLERAGAAGGYYELVRHADAAAGEPTPTVEILYFGLVPALHGRGLGRALLEHAITESRRLGAARVVLNTCTLDGPAALPNYLARGFRPVREERYVVAREPAHAVPGVP